MASKIDKAPPPPVAMADVVYVVVDSLFIVTSIVKRRVHVWFLFCCAVLFCNHLARDERAGCITFIATRFHVTVTVLCLLLLCY